MLTDEQKAVLKSAQDASDDIITLGGDTMLDISSQGAACQTYQFSDTIDSIDLSGLSTISIPSVTLGSGSSSTYNNGGNYIISTTGTGTSPSWNNTGWTTGTSSPTVNINTDGVDIKEGGDIKIGGRSLKEFMTKMEQRLSILVPDPEKLEKFEALKKAYEHYKTMEALCFPEKEEKEK